MCNLVLHFSDKKLKIANINMTTATSSMIPYSSNYIHLFDLFRVEHNQSVLKHAIVHFKHNYTMYSDSM